MPVNKRPLVLAIAFTESSLNYDAKHRIKTVEGICGINTIYWEDDLNENGIQVNSLTACLYVYEFYLDKTRNKKAAIKEYKGIKTKQNIYLVDKVIELENKIKGK